MIDLSLSERDAATLARAQAAYAGKPASYFAGARHDFIARLPKNPEARVLEIGCGSGATGRAIRAAGVARHIAGVELYPAAAAQARAVMDEVVVGDVETMELPFAEASFDALILSEVLEHLEDPWSVVHRAAALVRPGGLVLASSPNVAHWRIVAALAVGRFELTDSGPMDRTHKRWFTPSSFRRLFERAGFEVLSVGPVTPFATRTRWLGRLGGGRLDHLFMRQIAIVGTKN